MEMYQSHAFLEETRLITPCKIALTWAPEGKRRRGRPRETLKRTVEREKNEMLWKDYI